MARETLPMPDIELVVVADLVDDDVRPGWTGEWRGNKLGPSTETTAIR